MNGIFYLACLALVLLVSCEHDPEIFLKRFVLDVARNEACFQIYNSTDRVDDSTCLKPYTKERRSCAFQLDDDDEHCEIITPSNESIIVPCQDPDSGHDEEYYGIEFFSKKEKRCYMVRKGDEVQEVCPTLADNRTAVITTPDNYTLVVRSKDCYSGKWLSTILKDEEFADEFTFDPDERSCYKLFTSEQDITYRTCFEGIDSPKLCVRTWDKNPNCTVVTTPNNETVVIDCEGGTNTKENCVEIHKDGNSTEEVCMEQLEEGCMGITTPSGLRLLFACRFCRDQTKDENLYEYDKEELKSQRQFVKNLLEKGEYIKHKYEVWNDEYSYASNSRQSIYPYWLPNTTCYGLKLETNETIILQCTDRKFEPKECFKIIDPDEEGENDICTSVLEEKCVVIDTPKGERIFLGCYNELELIYKRYLDKTMADYQNGKYPLYHGSVSKFGPNCKADQYYMTRDEHMCWAVVTKDLEKISLSCPNKNKNNTAGCFTIYTQKYGADGQILPSSYTEDKVCADIVNEKCIGFTTPKGWTVLLDCYRVIESFGGVFKVKPKEPTDQF